MDLGGIIVTEMSQKEQDKYWMVTKSERERQILYDITYTWNLQNTTTELNKKEADSQGKKLLWAKGAGKGKLGIGYYDIQIIKHKISYKDILYNTKYSQYFITISRV